MIMFARTFLDHPYSEVVSGDELRAGDRELGDYYTVEGMPPGQWVGHSEQLLGVTGEVTQEQMAALFGEGLHPKAARILADGGTNEDVRLGQKYHQFGEANTEMTKRLDEEYARFRRTNGPAWGDGTTTVHVLMGQRRTCGAVEAEAPLIPVMVVTSPEEAERITTQVVY